MSEPRFLDYDKSLACIHCGLCLSSCPTYLETGDENDSPRGRIYLMRALQDGRLGMGATAVTHIDLCLGCRACEAVCPSGVRYGELLEGTRDHIEKQFRRPWWQRFLRRIVIEKIFPFPKRMKFAVWPAILLQRLGVARILPRFLRDTFELLPAQLSSVKLAEISAAADPKGRIGFISGCVMSVLFGSTNAASVRLLNRAGYTVVTPRDQVCCGALFAHSGQMDKARDCARRNVEVFEKLGLDAVIINAAGCGSTLKEYAHLLEHDPVWSERAKAFSTKIRDWTEFLATATLHSQAAGSNPGEPVVTVHDACHLAHAQRITKAPRDLVKSEGGAHFVELCEADVCCGSAGSYNLTEPAMAERLQRRKVENILKSGANMVVTTNPGCILQIRAGLKKAGRSDIEVLHIADYLERAPAPR